MEIFAALLEGIAPAIVEGLLNWAFHSAFQGNKIADAIVALFCYVALGAIVGGLSLLVLPTPFLSHPLSQGLALVAATVSAGLMAAAFGAWRRRRGAIILRVDRFAYGAALGFGYGIVRMLSA